MQGQCILLNEKQPVFVKIICHVLGKTIRMYYELPLITLYNKYHDLIELTGHKLSKSGWAGAIFVIHMS